MTRQLKLNPFQMVSDPREHWSDVMRTIIVSAFLMLLFTSGVAAEKPHLRDVPEIDALLIEVRIADKIRKKCDIIAARFFKANRLVFSLKDKARKMGYTSEEINAYINSDEDHSRQRKVRNEYLRAGGVDKDKPETYCALGIDEIEKGSQIGALLRMK
ncbi:MAG: DUF5333 domain-containing protein [Alphaproteobacteria bacterium]|nr:DUF5333 domain-containing protein [Alphaproteobacteria bacterium]MCH9831895.1 DUF5333 domain-containing protein [Alphaproteobacteria bacterium]